MSAHLAALRRMAGANDVALAWESSSFLRHVGDLLERIEYRRCDRGEDLEDIYRLRYKAYRLGGLVAPDAMGMVSDRLDDLPNCHRFAVYADGEMISTVRLHAVSAEHPHSPATSVYSDLLMPRLAQGERFIDPSRFAADPEWARIHPQVPYVTLRLAVMACFHFGASHCISMIRGDHVAFYKRVFQSKAIGEGRTYGGVINTTALLYEADVMAIRERVFTRYPFFQSTPMEQRLMFGTPPKDEPAPLTVLPTAKFLRRAA